MTNPPNDQSGGVNANAQGDLNIGADVVGRDKKIEQNTFNNFIITLHQWGSAVQPLAEEEYRYAPAINDAPTIDWDDTMNAALHEIARCENESTAFTTEVNIRMNVWAEVLTLLTNQGGAITAQSNHARVVFDAMGRDLEIYSDKISTLIPQFHHLWDRYFACHWRVLHGWGPPFRREQLVVFRQSIVRSLEILETRRKTQEGVLRADARLLKMAQDFAFSDVLIKAMYRIIAVHESLVDEIERGYAYVSHVLRRLDELTIDDSDLNAVSPVLVT